MNSRLDDARGARLETPAARARARRRRPAVAARGGGGGARAARATPSPERERLERAARARRSPCRASRRRRRGVARRSCARRAPPGAAARGGGVGFGGAARAAPSRRRGGGGCARRHDAQAEADEASRFAPTRRAPRRTSCVAWRSTRHAPRRRRSARAKDGVVASGARRAPEPARIVPGTDRWRRKTSTRPFATRAGRRAPRVPAKAGAPGGERRALGWAPPRGRKSSATRRARRLLAAAEAAAWRRVGRRTSSRGRRKSRRRRPRRRPPARTRRTASRRRGGGGGGGGEAGEGGVADALANAEASMQEASSRRGGRRRRRVGGGRVAARVLEGEELVDERDARNGRTRFEAFEASFYDTNRTAAVRRHERTTTDVVVRRGHPRAPRVREGGAAAGTRLAPSGLAPARFRPPRPSRTRVPHSHLTAFFS